MMARWWSTAGISMTLVLTVFGCDPDAFGPGGAAAFRTIGGIWAGNGLEDPEVGGVSPGYALSTKQGLDPNGFLLSTDAGIEVATYLVECALSADQSLSKTRKSDGQTFVLAGAVGLAPEWRDGACGVECQEWVTACMLARTNVTGTSVALWLSAAHPAIGLGHGLDYPLYEATFYGNLFQDPDAMYLCRGTDAGQGGSLGDYLRGRTCGGAPPEDCGFTQWGSCGDVGRCVLVNGYHTECADSIDPASGARHRSISTFVSATGWQ